VPTDAPIIGISAGRIPVAGRVVDGTQREYADRISDAGGVPVLLPVQPAGPLASLLDVLDGLLLTGGGDVDPERYGAERSPESGGIDPDRDGTELSLLDQAARHDVPVLAVCRGAQILNVFRGGSLLQHLPSVTAEPHLVIERRTEAVHSVQVDADSALGRIIGAGRVGTNSLHHQAVDRVGHHLVAVARADDGTVEAIEDPDGGVLAVQWHPEQMPDHPEHMRLFTWLVQAALGHRRLRH
jgi:putative glutamine amidotransferase